MNSLFRRLTVSQYNMTTPMEVLVQILSTCMAKVTIRSMAELASLNHNCEKDYQGKRLLTVRETVIGITEKLPKSTICHRKNQ